MRVSIIAAVAAAGLWGAQPALAQDAEGGAAEAAEAPIQVMRTNDVALTCVQISDEAAQLSQTMSGEHEGLLSRFGGVAKAGAAMVIPGAGLVTAAADALTQPQRERREARERSIERRWYYLNGLYAGQDCQAQAEAALSPDTPAPDVATGAALTAASTTRPAAPREPRTGAAAVPATPPPTTAPRR